MDRITRVRIKNVRAIESADLEVSSPLTVLIGENGAGKSTIIECLELLRKAAEPSFLQHFYTIHRGLPGLLRKGATALELGIVVEDDAGERPRIEYTFTLASQAAGAVIQSEQVLVGPAPDAHAGLIKPERMEALQEERAEKERREAELEALLGDLESEIERLNKRLEKPTTNIARVRYRAALKGKSEEDKNLRDEIDKTRRELLDIVARLTTQEEQARRRLNEPLPLLARTAANGEIFDPTASSLVPLPGAVAKSDRLAITSFGDLPPHKDIERLLAALRGIEVHLDFDTRASWAARAYQRPESLRVATTHFPADRLSLLGFNLANAWSELRSRETSHWDHTMAFVRLGLGESVNSVVVTPDPGGGNIYLALRFNDFSEPVLASNLSDGQLTWLAFVALVRLDSGRSFLAVDEPELHMHPYLLAGVVTLLKSAGTPVLLATHSDRVLELLDDPADAVRVCALEKGSRATISRVDPEELPKWLAHFGDFGRLRAAGYLSHVLVSDLPRPGT